MLAKKRRPYPGSAYPFLKGSGQGTYSSLKNGQSKPSREVDGFSRRISIAYAWQGTGQQESVLFLPALKFCHGHFRVGQSSAGCWSVTSFILWRTHVAYINERVGCLRRRGCRALEQDHVVLEIQAMWF